MKTEQGNTNTNKGFTLVEMAIAVAFLAIIGVVLLQLFLHAQNLGLKAHDLDQGVQISKSILETFKASKTLEEFKSDKLFGTDDVTGTGSSVSIRLGYDKDWSRIKMEQSSFTVSVEVAPVPSGSGENNSGMTGIQVTVLKDKPYAMEKDTTNEIYTISAEKDFD